MSEHRFSNSGRTRQQVIELAGLKVPAVDQTGFRGMDWLMGRRRFLLVPERYTGPKPEAMARYARMVLGQQAAIMRRLFWLGFLASAVAGFLAGVVGATWLLVK